MAEVEIIPLDSIQPDDRNANKGSERGTYMIRRSLEKLGAGRWQHQVDYRPFKKNRLILKEGVEIPEGVNNYGMVLVRKDV
jgi:hypothetical protein